LDDNITPIFSATKIKRKRTMKTRFPLFVRAAFIMVLLFSSVASTPYQPTERTAMEHVLDDLGGYECFEGSAFTCVTIDVPLDHFNAQDPRTIAVTFAVLPASGERKGMFVVATGGPGYSGVASADYYVSSYDPSIPEAFDIVFFDQRGVLLSGDQNCPYAGNAYYQKDAQGKTPAQEAALKQAASTFVNDCYSETSDPSLLPYLGTEQAVEDLEYFRQLIGDELFWLYGESYGTQYSQTYAAKYAHHLAGLILDGTVDLTLDGTTYYTQQAQAFSDTLTASLESCNDDPACRQDTLGNAVNAYDRLAYILERRPIHFRFPLPEGGFANRTFTLTNLEFVAASQVYSEGDRMMFTRALASFTSKLDLSRLRVCCISIWALILKLSNSSPTRSIRRRFSTELNVRITDTRATRPKKKRISTSPQWTRLSSPSRASPLSSTPTCLALIGPMPPPI